MKLLYDLLPVILFFLAYKFYGAIPDHWVLGVSAWLPVALDPADAGHAIYLATAVAMVVMVLQLAGGFAIKRKLEAMPLFTGLLIVVLGAATLLLHDPVFILWKPTLVNWLFAAVFLAPPLLGRATLVESLMGHALNVPKRIWAITNHAWVLFFVVSGLVNLFVAYTFSEAFWVDFKLFGMLGMTIVFILGQAAYLAMHHTEPDQHTSSGDSP
ncbi:septation protein A [Thioalkalivibrio denitrificans]|uniref:Inner membrane-spanning protein YciB n=1 Tax=Thioalkalivibrio denitrificans TaxID=108003 RepID=A0A1V3NLE7_9GAMM|nr:septation protein A [Thioalkalivibrio denitrificans]OOG25947.1 septation protein A [Thioalkalivibrio denitrificans]